MNAKLMGFLGDAALISVIVMVAAPAEAKIVNGTVDFDVTAPGQRITDTEELTADFSYDDEQEIANGWFKVISFEARTDEYSWTEDELRWGYTGPGLFNPVLERFDMSFSRNSDGSSRVMSIFFQMYDSNHGGGYLGLHPNGELSGVNGLQGTYSTSIKSADAETIPLPLTTLGTVFVAGTGVAVRCRHLLSKEC